MAFIDFDDLRNTIPIEDVAEWLGIKLTPRGDGTLRGKCPLCDSENKTSFTITPSKKLFGTFCCNQRGSLVKLVAFYRKIGQREAAEEIAEHFGYSNGNDIVHRNRSSDTSQKRREEGNGSSNVSPPNAGLEKVSERLSTDHDIIPALGLTPEICKAMGWGFMSKGTMPGRFLIALRKADGTLVGFLGVAADAELAPLLKFPPNLAEMVLDGKETKQEAPAGKFAHLRLAVNNK